MRFFPAIAALLAVALLFPSKSFAAGRKKSTPTPAPDTTDHITAIHLTSITVTLFANHQSKEFKVSPATKITVNGQPSQLSSLATGMSVAIATASDGVTAAAIDAKSPKR
ncbi:MAG TPA: hypothetical protein VKS98_02310 [Chthoniobacterales bacterium]|nr:hypothetical protein [Chthoniobacterales bacterium]